MNPNYVRAAVVLGLLSAAGPVAIDMYLPALPTMAIDLSSTPAAAQASLLVFFVALAFFQPLYGPLSDMVGRRRPLFFGLGLYTVAALGCAVAPNMETLIAMRFLQALGACACMVIPRAVVRDMYTGIEATRLMALIMLVFSIGPILAPLGGSLLVTTVGWRAIFVAMALISLAAMLLLSLALAETRSPEQRMASSIGSALASYRVLIRDPYFLGVCVIGASGLSGFFTFVSGSPFVYIEHFGLPPVLYSIAFSVNAIGFFSVAQLNARIAYRIGLRRMVRNAAAYYATVMVLVAMYFLLGGESIYVLLAGLFMGFAGLGLVIPAAAVLALEKYGATAGTASSLLGTIQFGFGVLSVGLMSASGDATPASMVSIIAGFGAVAAITARFVLRDDAGHRPPTTVPRSS